MRALSGTLTKSSAALSVVLGGLLEGLLGSMVRLGVGAADPTSSWRGEAGLVDGVACSWPPSCRVISSS
jgi:hypothetical protein